jgi:hypothetical protein
MKGEYRKMVLVSFIGRISLLFVILTFAATNYKADTIFAFHQNYPEFHTEDKVKEV